MKVSAYTLGCKVNQYESQVILEMLEKYGYTAVPYSQETDILIINSCTVTAKSNQKLRQTLSRARRQNNDIIIVLTGCMPQAFPDECLNLNDADIILGNTSYQSLPYLLDEFIKKRERIMDIIPHKSGEKFDLPAITRFDGHTRAFVKIEDGCNRFCSYCIIPYSRGRVRSKPLHILKEEIKALSENGYSEIVLVGINLCAYGQDIDSSLCEAVHTACSTESIERVRLGSLEPDMMTAEVIDNLAQEKKLCPQFHLSLQSGCDETLLRMNRHYTTKEYSEIVTAIRTKFPMCSITTDIMVGFAGETEEEFNSSLRFAEEISFSKAHVFAYSRRKGTKGYDMPNQITNAEKERRSKLMIAATDKSESLFLESMVGTVQPVLFERNISENIYEGYTPNYTLVRTRADFSLSKRILPVKLTSANQGFCFGVLV